MLRDSGIEYRVYKRAQWWAYGPEGSIITASSLQQLKAKLLLTVRRLYGEEPHPVLMVGAPPCPPSELPAADLDHPDRLPRAGGE
jgi:hypothetical protein